MGPDTKNEFERTFAGNLTPKGIRQYLVVKLRGDKMSRINYQRKPCKVVYTTVSGPVRCSGGALRGKDYCARHRPTSTA